MATRFEKRFEAYLARIQQAIPAKGGVEKAGKVWECTDSLSIQIPEHISIFLTALQNKIRYLFNLFSYPIPNSPNQLSAQST